MTDVKEKKVPSTAWKPNETGNPNGSPTKERRLTSVPRSSLRSAKNKYVKLIEEYGPSFFEEALKGATDPNPDDYIDDVHGYAEAVKESKSTLNQKLKFIKELNDIGLKCASIVIKEEAHVMDMRQKAYGNLVNKDNENTKEDCDNNVVPFGSNVFTTDYEDDE